jgi:uncharacterized protein YprB with RNaseH-like and TPR domain
MTDQESKLNIYLGQDGPTRRRTARLQPPRVGLLRETPFGEVWQVDWAYPEGYLHGSYELVRASGLHDLLDRNLEILNPASATVIDTETTGLAGGTGTYAFIIGAGFWAGDRYIIRQYVMRDFGEEAAQLWAFAQDLGEGIISYNGKCFDIPLLYNRFRLHRFDPPFENRPHLDMLFPCRRIWKRHLERFKLTDIEKQVIGYARTEDVPSPLIPSIFFDYLQIRDESLIYPILNHNRDDILSLYHLTVITSNLLDRYAKDGGNDDELALTLAEMCYRRREYDLTLTMLEKIKHEFASSQTSIQARKLKAMALKRQGCWQAACDEFDALYRISPSLAAALETAKIYEHKIRDYHSALDRVNWAMSLSDFEAYSRGSSAVTLPELVRRKARILDKISRP